MSSIGPDFEQNLVRPDGTIWPIGPCIKYKDPIYRKQGQEFRSFNEIEKQLNKKKKQAKKSPKKKASKRDGKMMVDTRTNKKGKDSGSDSENEDDEDESMEEDDEGQVDGDEKKKRKLFYE